MAKFKAAVTVRPDEYRETYRLGAAASTAENLSDTEVGKFMKLAGDSQYNLCAAGDAIEGQMLAKETATQDGWTIGTVKHNGRIAAVCDGLQATPGTGTIAVGDHVVCGTVVAKGTALAAFTGPKVCKATYQPSTLLSTVGDYTIAIPINLASVTAAGDILTDYVPGHAFKVKKVSFAVSVPVTTGAKAFDLVVDIGATEITGGLVALTSANCTPLGALLSGTAVTAGNTGTSTSAISLRAEAVTAFAEGAGYAIVTLQNLDTYNALLNSLPLSKWKVISLGNAGAVGDTCVIERI